MKAVILFQLYALLICSPPRLSADDVYKKRMDLVWRCINKAPLKAGMSPGEVQDIIGLPDNLDWNSVVVAGEDTYRVWACVEKNRNELKGWRDVVTAKGRFYGKVSYFVFWNEKLMATTLLPNLAGQEDNWFYDFSQKLLSFQAKSKPVSDHGKKVIRTKVINRILNTPKKSNDPWGIGTKRQRNYDLPPSLTPPSVFNRSMPLIESRKP